jgi:transcription initiation factor TFIID TATA-box-binding protein
MQISDDLSFDSTISNISFNENDCALFLDTEEIEYTPNVEELKPEINNIISSVNLGSNLNIKNIALKIKNAEYTNNFSKLLLKSKDAKATATIFSSGKMVCSGGKTEKQSKSMCAKFGKIVNKVGFNVELKNFKIQNIIASYDVKFKICLPKLFNKINTLINISKNLCYNYVKYNSDNFPGLIFYMNDLKVSLLVFEYGKIVISGAKKKEEIEEIFRNVYPLLIESKKINNEKE